MCIATTCTPFPTFETALISCIFVSGDFSYDLAISSEASGEATGVATRNLFKGGESHGKCLLLCAGARGAARAARHALLPLLPYTASLRPQRLATSSPMASACCWPATFNGSGSRPPHVSLTNRLDNSRFAAASRAHRLPPMGRIPPMATHILQLCEGEGPYKWKHMWKRGASTPH